MNPGLDPLYLFSMVLSHGMNKGLTIKRKGDHLASHWGNLNILRSEILGNRFKKLDLNQGEICKCKADLLIGRDLLGA